MWWKDMKMRVCLIVCIIILLIVIIVPAGKISAVLPALHPAGPGKASPECANSFLLLVVATKH